MNNLVPFGSEHFVSKDGMQLARERYEESMRRAQAAGDDEGVKILQSALEELNKVEQYVIGRTKASFAGDTEGVAIIDSALADLGFAVDIPKEEQKPPQPAAPAQPKFSQEEIDKGYTLSDRGIAVAQGATTVIRSLAQAFGANNPVAQSLMRTEDKLASLLSAAAQNDNRKIAEIMERANEEGIADDIRNALEAIAVAPGQGLLQAAGSVIPFLATGLLGSAARVGTAVMGLGSGVGIVKGVISEEVQKEFEKLGIPAEEAQAIADHAQSYAGPNIGQIFFGGALGLASAFMGVDPIARRIGENTTRLAAARMAGDKALIDKLTKEIGEDLAARLAKPSVKRILSTTAQEAGTESLQAGQEKYAGNVAVERKAFDRDPWQGVGAGALYEGALGGGLGVLTGTAEVAADRRRRLPPPPAVTPPAVTPAPAATPALSDDLDDGLDTTQPRFQNMLKALDELEDMAAEPRNFISGENEAFEVNNAILQELQTTWEQGGFEEDPNADPTQIPPFPLQRMQTFLQERAERKQTPLVSGERGTGVSSPNGTDASGASSAGATATQPGGVVATGSDAENVVDRVKKRIGQLVKNSNLNDADAAFLTSVREGFDGDEAAALESLTNKVISRSEEPAFADIFNAAVEEQVQAQIKKEFPKGQPPEADINRIRSLARRRVALALNNDASMGEVKKAFANERKPKAPELPAGVRKEVVDDFVRQLVEGKLTDENEVINNLNAFGGNPSPEKLAALKAYFDFKLRPSATAPATPAPAATTPATPAPAATTSATPAPSANTYINNAIKSIEAAITALSNKIPNKKFDTKAVNVPLQEAFDALQQLANEVQLNTATAPTIEDIKAVEQALNEFKTKAGKNKYTDYVRPISLILTGRNPTSRKGGKPAPAATAPATPAPAATAPATAPDTDPATPAETTSAVDELYEQAVQFVTESRKASTNPIQKKFNIGYKRARELLLAMEKAGVVSPAQANGKRTVLTPDPATLTATETASAAKPKKGRKSKNDKPATPAPAATETAPAATETAPETEENALSEQDRIIEAQIEEARGIGIANARGAFDYQGEYKSLEDSIGGYRDNVRTTLEDNKLSAYEEQAFAAYDAEIARLREQADQASATPERSSIADNATPTTADALGATNNRKGALYWIAQNKGNLVEETRGRLTFVDIVVNSGDYEAASEMLDEAISKLKEDPKLVIDAGEQDSNQAALNELIGDILASDLPANLQAKLVSVKNLITELAKNKSSQAKKSAEKSAEQSAKQPAIPANKTAGESDEDFVARVERVINARNPKAMATWIALTGDSDNNPLDYPIFKLSLFKAKTIQEVLEALADPNADMQALAKRIILEQAKRLKFKKDQDATKAADEQQRADEAQDEAQTESATDATGIVAAMKGKNFLSGETALDLLDKAENYQSQIYKLLLKAFRKIAPNIKVVVVTYENLSELGDLSLSAEQSKRFTSLKANGAFVPTLGGRGGTIYLNGISGAKGLNNFNTLIHEFIHSIIDAKVQRYISNKNTKTPGTTDDDAAVIRLAEVLGVVIRKLNSPNTVNETYTPEQVAEWTEILKGDRGVSELIQLTIEDPSFADLLNKLSIPESRLKSNTLATALSNLFDAVVSFFGFTKIKDISALAEVMGLAEQLLIEPTQNPKKPWTSYARRKAKQTRNSPANRPLTVQGTTPPNTQARPSPANSNVGRSQQATEFEAKRGLFQSIAGALRMGLTPTNRKLLGVLTTPDLIRLGQYLTNNKLPGMQKVADLIGNMTAFRNNLINTPELRGFVDEWRAFNRNGDNKLLLEEVQAIATLLDHNPTLRAGMPTSFAIATDHMIIAYRQELAAVLNNPNATPLRKKRKQATINKRLADREQALKDFYVKWKKLASVDKGQGVKLFKAAADHYEFLFNTHLRVLTDIITKSNIPASAKQNLITALTATFAQNSKLEMFFPLKRFGQYIVVEGAGRDKAIYTFESEAARDEYKKLVIDRLNQGRPKPLTEQELKDLGIFNISNELGAAQQFDLQSSRLLRNLFEEADGIAQVVQTGKGGPRAMVDLNDLKDAVYQMYLMSLPDKDIRTRMRHRKGYPGYNTDSLRVFSHVATANAAQLARLKYSRELSNAVDTAKSEADSLPKYEKLKTLVEELDLRVTDELTPYSPEPGHFNWRGLAANVNRVTFTWMLTSLSSALIQPTQYIVGATTILAYGVKNGIGATRTLKILGNYLKPLDKLGIKSVYTSKTGNVITKWGQPSVIKSSYVENHPNPVMKAALKTAWHYFDDRNRFQDTYTAQQLSTMGETPSSAYDSLLHRGARAVMNFMGGAFHHLERLTREAVFMSAFEVAYRAAKNRGMSDKLALAKALKDADTVGQEGMFSYDQFSKSRYTRGALARIATQFMSFAVQMTSFLVRNFVSMLPYLNKTGKKEALTKFSLVVGAYGATAGVKGLPFYSAIIGVLSALREQMRPECDGTDEEACRRALVFDASEENILAMRNLDLYIWDELMPKMLGTELSKLMEYGILNYATGQDWHTKLTLGGLFFSMSDINTSQSGEDIIKDTMFTYFLGPTGSLITNAFAGIGYMQDGEYVRGLEKMTPAAFRGLVTAYRYKQEGGAYTPKQYSLLPPDASEEELFTFGKMLGQIAGVRPAQLKEDTDRSWALKKMSTEIKAERSRLMNRYNALLYTYERQPTEANLRRFKMAEENILKFIAKNGFGSYDIDEETLKESYEKYRESRERATSGLVLDKGEEALLYPLLLRGTGDRLSR